MAAAGELNPYWLAAFVVGAIVFFAVLRARKPAAAATPPSTSGPDAFRARLAAAFQAAGPEIEASTAGPAKQRALAAWREAMDRNAHDYVDLMMKHPRHEEILAKEVDHWIRAWLCGCLARLGKLDPSDARQSAYLLGRDLRDGLRAMGVPIDTLSANLGTGMDKAFESVVEAGRNYPGDR